MAPFQYDTPSAPLTGSIADVMLRGGDIRAQLAMETARLHAASTVARGQMWGNIVGGVSQLPLQIDEARRATATAQQQGLYRQMQMAQLGQQLQDKQTATDQQKLFDRTINELAPKYKTLDPVTNTPILDFDGLTSELRARNLPDHLIGDWTTRAMQSQTAIGNYTKQQQAERQSVVDQLAGMAQGSQSPADMARNITDAAQQGVLPAAQARAALQGLNEAGENFPSYKAGLITLSRLTQERIGKDAAQAAATAKDLADARKTPTPLPLEQQLLSAVASGDKESATRILGVITSEAQAKRDPAALANAQAMFALNREMAQARLDKAREGAKPYDLAPDVKTTSTGHDYVDLSTFTVAERPKVREAAHQLGATIVNKEESSALQEIDNARFNQRKIMNQIGGLLPKDPVGRIIANPLTKLETIFQTDEQKAAFKSWRTTAIQTLRAVAGSKGLRINEAEILLSAANDIPQITDTYKTAQQRYQNVLAQLQSVEDSILVHDRMSLNPQPETTGPPEPFKLTPGLQRLRDR